MGAAECKFTEQYMTGPARCNYFFRGGSEGARELENIRLVGGAAHAMESRYGCMTRETRQMRAKRARSLAPPAELPGAGSHAHGIGAAHPRTRSPAESQPANTPEIIGTG